MSFNKKFLRLMAVLFILSLIGEGLFIFHVKNSKPYFMAKNFLETNTVINNQVGKPIKYKMNPFTKAELKYFLDGTGKANFEITLEGIKRNGVAIVDLKDDGAGWNIVYANLLIDNNKIDLIENGSK